MGSGADLLCPPFIANMSLTRANSQHSRYASTMLFFVNFLACYIYIYHHLKQVEQSAAMHTIRGDTDIPSEQIISSLRLVYLLVWFIEPT